jgi:hypothetical protein
MDGYDFLIDVDAGDFEDIDGAYQSTREIISFFDFKDIPYEIRFSGKGFHLIIPHNYFSLFNVNYTIMFNLKEEKNVYQLYSKIAKKLSDRFSEMIDLKIYDSRRVCKIPFSLALYKERIYVCYPFTTIEEFDDFRLINFELWNFNKPIRQEKRTVFNADGNIKGLLEVI